MIVLDQLSNGTNRPYLTVSALTKYIKAKLEGDRHLVSIYLKGEISNYKRHSRGHLYFTLKDDVAQISAIMFSKDADRLSFPPKEGDHVLVQGRISLYEPSGTYSIHITQMTLDGIGELYLKYEALKKELEEKGYFRMERKRPIPPFPKVIGVVTSPTGAVIQDIIHTVTRRYPLAEIHLYPALVQGPGSAESVKQQILYANALKTADVLIVGRGGGSIEDLWGFNEMPVIEAIYTSTIPIITAIGHETDFTLSDFVSDLRAPTPTAAAELATPSVLDLKVRISDDLDQITYRLAQLFEMRKTELMYLDQRLERYAPQEKLKSLHEHMMRLTSELERNIHYIIDMKRMSVDRLKDGLKSPLERLKGYQNTQQQFSIRLIRAIQSVLERKSNRFDINRAKLETLNPLAVMDKGFALITKDTHVISSIDDLRVGDDVELRLKDGQATAKIQSKKEM